MKETVQFLQQRLWGGQASETIETVLKKAGEGFGRDLSPEAQEVVKLSFGAWVSADPERSDRYVNRDAKLVDEFYSLLDKGFISPSATTNVVKEASKVKGQTKLPQSGPGATLVSSKPDEKKKSLDDLRPGF